MYTLDNVDFFRISEAADTYIYDIVPIAGGLATISSDDCFRLLDPESLSGPALNVVSGITDITCLEAVSSTVKSNATTICTGGRDGRVCVIDPRSGIKTAEVRTEHNAAILSLASSHAFALAAGTELVNHEASIIFWDLRQLGPPVLQYSESHSDDVTELHFHPARPQVLLSGSTDGLVNIYNCNISDEDDALHQAINHGASIHHANFLNETDIFAISHDEKFSTYELAADPEPGIEEPPAVHHGDLRELLKGDYVADVVTRPDGSAAIGIGAHNRHNFDLIQFKKSPTWTFAPDSKVTLLGGHGSEIVRALCFIDSQRTVLTAGEDGEVKAWRGA